MRWSLATAVTLAMGRVEQAFDNMYVLTKCIEFKRHIHCQILLHKESLQGWVQWVVVALSQDPPEVYASVAAVITSYDITECRTLPGIVLKVLAVT